MAPLKNRQREFPFLDSRFLQFCSSHGIVSEEGFLVNDLYSLVASAEGEPTSEKLKQAIVEMLTLIYQRHQPWCNALDLLEDNQKNKRFLPTGCKNVDTLLGGGLRGGQVIELVGLSASGKTQFCLHVAAHTAHEQLGRIVFFDTGNSFSPRRISTFLDQFSLTEEGLERRLERAMNSIACVPVFDIYELLGALNRLRITLEQQSENEPDKLRLLIVDSISSLISPILGGKDPQGRSLMVSAGYALKRLAHEHNICVLVTNHMVGGEGGVPKPALGESWKTIPHVRILLVRDMRRSVSTLSVLKHTSAMGENASSYVHMVQHLIEQCLLFRMTREECVETLSRRAGIQPIVTSTVWKELERENKGFFAAYSQLTSNAADITHR